MAGNKSPKTIATINFKGGVGKTTVTWCLADTLSTYSNATVLMFDLDAQMSLTQAVGLNEDSGSLHPAFGSWYYKCVNDRRTIFDAIDQYTKPAAAHFDLPSGDDFIYQISKGLHFVPSVCLGIPLLRSQNVFHHLHNSVLAQGVRPRNWRVLRPSQQRLETSWHRHN